MKRALEVIRPGPLALVQDQGRFGYGHLGVGRSGAADRGSFALANRLVGNNGSAAAVECTFGGLVVRARGDLLVALAGAPAPMAIDRSPVPHAMAVQLRDGQTLLLRTPQTGVRSYLAVRGGIDVPAVLGSRSTDTLSALGPAPLTAGSSLPVGAASAPVPPLTPNPPEQPLPEVGVLGVVPGPRDDWFDRPADLAVGEWVVSQQSNRVGLRLDRPPPGDDEAPAPTLTPNTSRELPSEGVVLGSIQVPPGGQPVLFLADHPVTGGYPVIAVVLDADIDRAAQARPGNRLRFTGFPDR
jgi:biotin-dependent carboxylase-like uncharacterized protein